MIIVPDAQRKRYYDSLAAADKAGLDKVESAYKKIVEFYYFNLLKTSNTIFAKWGSNP